MPYRPPVGAWRPVSVTLFFSMLIGADAAQAQSTLTITHQEVPAPTLLDLGEPGASVGDMRLWHFNGQADDGSQVRVDWKMTTTGVNPPNRVSIRESARASFRLAIRATRSFWKAWRSIPAKTRPWRSPLRPSVLLSVVRAGSPVPTAGSRRHIWTTAPGGTSFIWK